VYLSDTLKAC